MKKIIAVALITALIISGVSITVLSQKTPEKPVYVAQTVDTPLNADTIFNLVNAEREKAGLKPLARDAGLDATAQARADDMMARNYFSHYDPITGENLVKIKKSVSCVYASENIAGDFEYNSAVVRSWMESKPHHDAILDPQYDSAGLAVSGNKVVQHFCNN